MVKLRAMDLKDVDRVHKIERETFSNPLSKNSLIKELKENDIARYYVIDLDGDVLGYFGYWIVQDQGHILNIAVDKDFRNKGYGSDLISHLIKSAKDENIKKLTLEVRESNKIARHLYEKFGFEVLGMRRGYYRDPKEDAYIMWLNLEEI